MPTSEDPKPLIEIWAQLTPAQQKTLARRAKLYRLQYTAALLVLRLFLIVTRLVTPMPRRVIAHWL